jgi:glycosyltransferase involved in cell wall biosynthesis
MAEITVVVPARNASATIGRTLAALAAQEVSADYEVIVVDSGSEDATPAIVEASGVATALLRNPGGEPAGSRNIGVRHGTGGVLAFTDADCEPAPGWLAAGMRGLAKAEIVQGKVLPAGPHGPFDRTLGVVSEYGLYETANLFATREVFDRVGGFEAVVALDTGELVPGSSSRAGGLGNGSEARPFGEDVWFVWRAKRSGARTAFAADALVHHAVFERKLRDAVAERSRCRYFPPLVALIPELRRHFLHAHVFLTPSSMRFDLALAGVAASAGLRSWWPGLLGAAPYGAALARELRRQPLGLWPRVAAGTVAADAVMCAALVRGSVHARTLVC